MTDQGDVYERFPFPEVMREKAALLLERTIKLATDGDSDPGEDELVVERVIEPDGVGEDGYPLLRTELTIFVPIFNAIHPILLEAETPPKYVVDTLCAIAKSFEERRAGNGTMPIASDENLREEFVTRWQEHEADRILGNTWRLFHSSMGRLHDLEVCFIPMDERWELGFRFVEEREYEVYGRNIYRVLDGGNHKFTDPIGTEGDRDNANDGYYLPTRLKLPTPAESVKIPDITLTPPRTRPD